MNMKIYLLGFAALLAWGCQTNSSPSPVQENTPAPSSPTEQKRQAEVLAMDTLNAVQDEVVRKTPDAAPPEFEVFFRNFVQTIARQDAAAFNRFIDPQRGLYTIETTGAVPNFHLVRDIAQHRLAKTNQPFFSIREQIKTCNLTEAKAFPKVTCEGDGDAYAQKGCFLTDGAAFREQRIHRYASLPETENQAIDATLPLVSKAVLHTASGYKFYFGRVNGQWKVLFIDLMTPCSA
jgi:hypothetical protein